MKEIETLIAQATLSTDLAQRHEAFGEIVLRFQDMAFGCAYSILGDFQLAEDAAQEAFLETYRNLPKLREAKAFSSWFRQIVVRQCHRMMRRKSLPTESIEAALEMPSPHSDPAAAVEEHELKERVLAAVQQLPEDERMVTTLFYINGYSQKEIAAFMEVSERTVRNRLHASRERLKERLVDNMVQDTLSQKRPSRDEKFVKEVLFKAIHEADTEKVSELLDENPDLIDAQDANGRTPIEAMKHTEWMSNLTWTGAVANAGERFKSVYDALTAKGAKPDIVAAVWADDSAGLKALLKADPELVHKPLLYPSHFARGWDEHFETELDKGRVPAGIPLPAAPVEVQQPGKRWRVVTGDRTCTIEKRDERYYGLSPKRFEVDAIDKMLPLTLAASFFRLESAKTLLEAGADPNADRNQAVIQAAGWGPVELLKLLLQHGAKVDVTEQDNSPIIAATYGNNIEVIRLLAANGANPNVRVPGQPSAMTIALRHPIRVHGDDCREETIEALIEAGAADEDDAVMAIHRGRIDLLEKHLDANPERVHARFPIVDYGGYLSLNDCTLLHILAEFAERPNAVAIAKLLIERGADVNARAPIYDDGTGGHTPLFNAIVGLWKSNLALLKLLIERGADPTIKAKMFCKSHERLRRSNQFYGSVPLGKDQPQELSALEHIQTYGGFNYILKPAAIKLFNGQSAVPVLIQMLIHEKASHRKEAAWALGTFGESAKEAVPALKQAVNDEDEQVRQQATWALDQIG